MEPPRDLLAEDRIWAQIDHQLVSLKSSLAVNEFEERCAQREREYPRGNLAGAFAAIKRANIEFAKEWTPKLFEIYGEVWANQGKPRTPDFIRVVFDKGLLPVIAGRVGTAESKLTNLATRTRDLTNLPSILASLAQEGDRLKSEWGRRIEVEARELLLAQAKRSVDSRKATPQVSKAPTPLRELNGGGWIPRGPKPLRRPPDWPLSYPHQIKPRSEVVLTEAFRKFQARTEILDLCKYVISELTPELCARVRDETLRADLALSAMEALTVYLARLNSEPAESDRLNQEVKNSDQWLALAQRLVAASKAVLGTGLSHKNRRTDRRKVVDSYIAEVFEKTGKRITRVDIWKAARYKTRTEFERWERNDPKRSNKSANDRFTRILLTEKPHLK